MKNTTAKVLCCLQHPTTNDRFISVLVKFPRIIEAEFLRHRALSFSAESSRAKNIQTHLQSVSNTPFTPFRFPKEQRGMMNKEWLEQDTNVRGIWNDLFSHTKIAVKAMAEAGVHKAIASRPLQPFEYQEMIVSGTEWADFFYLRAPHYVVDGKTYYSKNNLIEAYPNREFDFDTINVNQAQPEIQVLAEKLLDAVNAVVPITPEEGKWYGAYLEEGGDLMDGKIASAKCARISYNAKKDFSDEDNLDLFGKLMVRPYKEIPADAPRHPSPTEHIVTVMTNNELSAYKQTRIMDYDLAIQQGKTIIGYPYKDMVIQKNMAVILEKGVCKNLRGFIPLRYYLENFNI